MSIVSPFLLELQWFFNILFHTNLTLSPFKLFSVFIINLGKDFYFFLVYEKKCASTFMFFPVFKVHISGSIFSGICQVRAWSCIAKVNRNFSVPFYFILFYFTQCCSYQVPYIHFWFTALWDEQGLWLLAPWHQARSNMWAIYSMHALLGVTWLHVHKKKNKKTPPDFVAIQLCSYGNNTY